MPSRACLTALVTFAIRYGQNPSKSSNIPEYLGSFFDCQPGEIIMMEKLLQDLRFGLRVLLKSPGFAAVAVLTLALGIGANTAIFSIINAVLLRPLPFQEQDRLVQLWETESAPGNYPFTGPDYLDWQAQSKTLQATSAYTWPRAMSASTGTESQPVSAIATQSNFFSVLGVQPILGRSFAAEENHPGKKHVVILSYGFWQKFFAGRREILDRPLQLDSESYTIVGVLPSWFNFPNRADIFVPMDMSTKGMLQRGTHWFRAIGRLRPGQTITSSQAELSGIAKNLEKQYPESNGQVGAVVVSLREQLTGSSRPQLLVILGAVGLVLMVACFNVANLLLARATGRLREIALRVVLGASRWRIVRQLLTESLLLSTAGAVIGLAGAWWCTRMVEANRFLPIPRTNAIQIDWIVLLFTVIVSVLVGIVFGLAPALQASKLDLGEELKSSAQAVLSPSGWTRWFRDGLVVAEIALSLALLAGAGLLIRSFQKMRTAETGIDPQNVMTLATFLPQNGYTNLPARQAFFDQLLARSEHMPGVTAAAAATELPLEGGNNGYIKVDGDPDPTHETLLVENNYITPGYFSAMGIPLLAGSAFTAADMTQAAEIEQKLDEMVKHDPERKDFPPEIAFKVLISRTMAKTFWPNQNPVGRIYRSSHGTIPIQVIGVVGDVSTNGVREKSRPQSYFAFTRTLTDDRAFANIVIRSTVPPSTVLPAIRKQLREMDSSLTVFRPRTMSEVISESTQDAEIQTWLLGSFAGLALLLAAVGLYSVLAYLVNQRTREIGIRMALGAQQNDVLRLVMGHAGVLTITGIAMGVAGALLLTRFMESLLYGIHGRDPLTFTGVVGVLALVALLACYVPARRAMRVDPMVALRYE
jgi:putative ABC transport system permease protein